MKNRRWKALGRVLAPLQAALLFALGIAVPVLDGAERAPVPVLESKHSDSSCVLGHDHTVCTQFSSNRVLSSVGPRHGAATDWALASGIPASQDAPFSASPLVHHSRAPPLG